MINFLNDDFFEANESLIKNLASQWFSMNTLTSISSVKVYCEDLKRSIILNQVDSNMVSLKK